MEPTTRDPWYELILCRYASERFSGGVVALDASILLQSRNGDRVVKLDDFYRVPGETPERESTQPGRVDHGDSSSQIAMGTKVDLLEDSRPGRLRVCARFGGCRPLDVDGDHIRDARVAVGGVGTKPWNLPQVRDALIGQPLNQQTFETAAKLATEGAKPLRHNAFKVELVQRTIVRALMNLEILA